ncbi:hypothetical protein C0Q70_12658 [Pomacea canaliculata]|uniref:Uncharacterized protein n=1 Tax=Pomacea canaliculata TaxID=400727 RepID=A0A2T7P244_POMCA|nr:hypothetical protein C0Q70_12658 [Pomacea canaliculata]
MYRIPESLPLHTSRPPVDSNSYLPSVPSCSPFNPHEGASSRQTPCRRSSSYLYRHLAVRSHPVPGSYGDVYLTPRTSSSCSTSPLTLQSCGLTTDQWPQQGNPCMEPRARQTTRMVEENGDDAGECR